MQNILKVKIVLTHKNKPQEKIKKIRKNKSLVKILHFKDFKKTLKLGIVFDQA